jgi:hypothetical protein
MKLRVLETFYDKQEVKYVNAGSVIEREDERAKRLINLGLAEELKEEQEKPKKGSRKSEK